MSKFNEALSAIEDEALRQSLMDAHEEDVSGLKANQAKALDEAKKAKRERDEFKPQAEKFTELSEVVGARDVKQLGEILGDYDNGKLVKAGQEVDTEELKRRMREQWDVEARSKYQPIIEERDTLAEERDTYRKSLEAERIDNRAMAAAAKFGVDGNSLELVNMLARREWQLEDDGTPVIRDGEGNIMVGKNGAMTFEEWIDGPIREKYAPLFPKPVGGGAVGNNGNTRTQNNPFKKETLNLTEQARIHRENPQLAARLQSEAG